MSRDSGHFRKAWIVTSRTMTRGVCQCHFHCHVNPCYQPTCFFFRQICFFSPLTCFFFRTRVNMTLDIMAEMSHDSNVKQLMSVPGHWQGIFVNVIFNVMSTPAISRLGLSAFLIFSIRAAFFAFPPLSIGAMSFPLLFLFPHFSRWNTEFGSLLLMLALLYLWMNSWLP